jgi:hypothetical protein
MMAMRILVALGITLFVVGLPQTAMAGSRATSRSCVNGVCKTETSSGSGNRASASSSSSASSRGGSSSSVYTSVDEEDAAGGGGGAYAMAAIPPYEGIESILTNFPSASDETETTTTPDQSTDESGSEPYCPEIINGDESAVVLDPNCGALAQEEEEEQATEEAIQNFEVGFLEYQILQQLITYEKEE